MSNDDKGANVIPFRSNQILELNESFKVSDHQPRLLLLCVCASLFQDDRFVNIPVAILCAVWSVEEYIH
jgi:hypothetical protein